MKPEYVLPSQQKLIYGQIAERGILSKSELMTMNQLTSSTLTRYLEEMLAKALIVEKGLGQSSGGRRPILYQVNPDYRYIFGLEISRFSSTLGLFDMHYNPKSLVRWRMDEAMTPERLVEHAVEQMRAFLRDHNLSQEQVLGMGIGAVGPLDREAGVIRDPLYFPAGGWSDVAICRMFEERTGFRSVLENGANAALVGEHWAIRDENVRHALYVHAGVGLRSAMMSHGRLVHGTVDMEGSIGQMVIHTDGDRLDNSGNYGALEAYASVPALLKQARALAKMAKSGAASPFPAHVPPELLGLDDLLHALMAGDEAVRSLFSRSAVFFGIGLANLINVFHPDRVILGGALIVSNPLFYDTATETAKSNTCYYPKYTPLFSKGTLKEDAVVTGAAIVAGRSLLDI